MKTIEEIEKISFEELEKAAADGSIIAPEGMTDRIAETLAAMEIAGERCTRKGTRSIFVGFALATAASLAIVLTLPDRPKDTFSDPKLAYAQLERTFEYISSKMDRGLEIAGEAEPIVDRTVEYLK